ncbi:cellulose biosynthesis protein BcsN [Methylobacterium sp. J-068]|uniref:cellulose biosynthesis protein BcsN n=1 Tax=Methylobacterium sp. J-068 TaxID=2836649 RepID=UPI001FBAF70A|nr:cellulose biosynthesis protein BcsN [Methylobacterium sp. J-068]MCJ2032797.1 cellulose biosynthesis protein BcsN [Methylobacterium sp. J-068]
MTRRLISLFALALALGACNARTPTGSLASPRYASLDATLDARADSTAGLSDALPPERRASPVAVLPAWIGRPTRLREHDDAGAFEQVVSLGPTPRGQARENLVMVRMAHAGAASGRLTDGSAAFMGRPTEAGIRAEMEAVFPGVPMQVVERPSANSYGPYGLAIGRGAGGARCLYAWQWIAEPPALQGDGSVAAPLSLRVRLCRSDITLEAMAAAVNQLRLVPRFAGQPVEAPRRAVAQPAGTQPERRRTRASVRRPDPDRTPRGAASADRGASARQAAPDTQERRYLGADTASVAAPAPIHPAGAVPVSASVVRGTLAGLGAVPAATSATISADLPPEAYRGPPGNPSR